MHNQNSHFFYISNNFWLCHEILDDTMNLSYLIAILDLTIYSNPWTTVCCAARSILILYYPNIGSILILFIATLIPPITYRSLKDLLVGILEGLGRGFLSLERFFIVTGLLTSIVLETGLAEGATRTWWNDLSAKSTCLLSAALLRLVKISPPDIRSFSFRKWRLPVLLKRDEPEQTAIHFLDTPAAFSKDLGSSFSSINSAISTGKLATKSTPLPDAPITDISLANDSMLFMLPRKFTEWCCVVKLVVYMVISVVPAERVGQSESSVAIDRSDQSDA